MARALSCRMAGVRRDEDFAAWQLADAFKKEVFRLVRGSRDAQRDFRYRDQLRNAASGISKHITEGFLRFSPLDFARFLDYALGSLGEAERRLGDGVELDYFARDDCRAVFQLARRCSPAIRRLKQSQIRYAEGLRRRDRGRPRKRDSEPLGRKPRRAPDKSAKDRTERPAKSARKGVPPHDDEEPRSE